MQEAIQSSAILERLEVAVRRAEAAAKMSRERHRQAVHRYALLERGAEQALEALDAILTDPVRAEASAA